MELALCVQFPFLRPPLGPLATLSAVTVTYYGETYRVDTCATITAVVNQVQGVTNRSCGFQSNPFNLFSHVACLSTVCRLRPCDFTSIFHRREFTSFGENLHLRGVRSGELQDCLQFLFPRLVQIRCHLTFFDDPVTPPQHPQCRYFTACISRHMELGDVCRMRCDGSSPVLVDASASTAL